MQPPSNDLKRRSELELGQSEPRSAKSQRVSVGPRFDDAVASNTMAQRGSRSLGIMSSEPFSQGTNNFTQSIVNNETMLSGPRRVDLQSDDMTREAILAMHRMNDRRSALTMPGTDLMLSSQLNPPQQRQATGPSASPLLSEHLQNLYSLSVLQSQNNQNDSHRFTHDALRSNPEGISVTQYLQLQQQLQRSQQGQLNLSQPHSYPIVQSGFCPTTLLEQQRSNWGRHLQGASVPINNHVSIEALVAQASQVPSVVSIPPAAMPIGIPLPTQGRTAPRSTITLSSPQDKHFLSEHQMFLRAQVEVFQATEDDVTTHTRGRNKAIQLGQVGIRCRHCAHVPASRRQKGSVYFPAAILGIYQASQNMSTTHIQCGLCTEMPDSYKMKFVELLPTKNISSKGGRKYWAETARQLGLVDTEDGIRVGPVN